MALKGKPHTLKIGGFVFDGLPLVFHIFSVFTFIIYSFFLFIIWFWFLFFLFHSHLFVLCLFTYHNPILNGSFHSPNHLSKCIISYIPFFFFVLPLCLTLALTPYCIIRVCVSCIQQKIKKSCVLFPHRILRIFFSHFLSIFEHFPTGVPLICLISTPKKAFHIHKKRKTRIFVWLPRIDMKALFNG